LNQPLKFQRLQRQGYACENIARLIIRKAWLLCEAYYDLVNGSNYFQFIQVFVSANGLLVVKFMDMSVKVIDVRRFW
jgi:hypothetical protein